MNKILVVGHPASGYREVESVLNQCGMLPAKPSKRECMLPQDMTAALCKVHAAPSLEDVVSEEDLQQIQAGPVWHGMALDLMLGNLEQPLWGWADPQSVFLLDYWEKLDPKLTFVLVYDEPHRALIEAVRGAGENPIKQDQDVGRLLDNWAAYNGVLLQFYLRHSSRCLLVHSQQVRRAVDSYLQKLQPMVGVPLLKAPDFLGEVAELSSAFNAAARSEPLRGLPSVALPELAHALSLAGWEEKDAIETLTVDAAERYLIDVVLENHPTAMRLYAELQSAASLPFDTHQRVQHDAGRAWQALVDQRVLVFSLLVKLYGEYRLKREGFQNLEHELEQARIEHAHQIEETRVQAEERAQLLLCQVESLTTQLSQQDQKLREYEQANAQLFTQLHQVQEELERQHLRMEESERRHEEQTRALQEQADLLVRKQVEQARLEEELQAIRAERVKLEDELKAVRMRAEAEALEAAVRDKHAKELAEENDLLLSQLHLVQEELERYYHENQQLKSQLFKPESPGPYGAADRIKRQLSYRLGATMIRHSRSLGGWLSMPWALAAEVRAYRKDRAARGEDKLPPIHTYRDAHEADRLKRHLSYRLGKTLIKYGKTPWGWVRLPFALRQQVLEFRLEREKGEQ